MNYNPINVAKLSEDKDIKLEWLVKDLIPLNEPTMFYGGGGSFKSTLVLHLALCIQAGLPFHYLETKPMRVLLLSLEGHRDVAPRCEAHWRKYGKSKVTWFAVEKKLFMFGNKEHESALYDLIRLQKIGLLIIDTLSLSTEGDINSSSTSGMVTRQLRRMCNDLALTIILIHHTGKEDRKGMKGASEFSNNVPCVIRVKNKRIIVEKQRSGRAGLSLAFDSEQVQINDEGDTAICVTWKQGEIKTLFHQYQQLHGPDLDKKELIDFILEHLDGTKSRDNVRTQVNRELAKQLTETKPKRPNKQVWKTN